MKREKHRDGNDGAKDCSRIPHFLCSLVALMYFMRLSLMKAAHVDDGRSSVQEIRAIDMPLLK